MLQTMFDVLIDIGITGLFIAMFFKGSTIPLPSLIFIVSYGYLLNPNQLETIGLAVAMSLTFTFASYIPYGIGYKLEDKLQRKFGDKLAKAKQWFQRYGEWSVFFTRPFTIGMYISYVAGMGKVKPIKYGILTFFGILPWSIFILYLSKAFHGDLDKITEIMKTYMLPIGITVVLLIVMIYFYKIRIKAKN